ncbi:MAG: ATPase domain-containing protein [Candidatus Nanohaloarchaea archaeon]|nr:ATPase domain-containing protein [Candidatus Nanohaloarchaea archaeon]
MPAIERVSTGIGGLDQLLQGGLPAERSILLSGAAGTGKTIYGLNFLWNGLVQGENGAFISMGAESKEKLIEKGAQVGLDLAPHFDSGDLSYHHLNPERDDIQFFNKVNEIVTRQEVDRIVIDSLSVMLGEQEGDEAVKRKQMYKLDRNLQNAEATTIMTAELQENNPSYLSRYGVAEHVVDGVIRLEYSGVGEESFRQVEVRKMEGTDHASGKFSFIISDDGISVRAHTGL